MATVILFHSNLGLMPSGFLGVDVFFVISGYLLSGIIIREIRAGEFTFRDFYLRRIRRLFPASFCTLAITLLGSLILLTPSAWDRFAPQMFGSLAFATNMVLWKQINYFNNSAAFEPLLHMWSLAVEEQYYLFLPLFLRFTPRELWLPAILFLLVVSLAAYTYEYPRSPGVAFYLLPTRAWELAIGAGATFVPRIVSPTATLKMLSAASVAVLIALPFGLIAAVPSYLLAIPATVATGAILVLEPTFRASYGIGKALGWLGDRSYSLYLVHWPLFAFANSVFLTATLPLWLALTLIVLTLALGSVQYRFVEEPVRASRMKQSRIWSMLITGSAVLAIGCALSWRHERSVRPLQDFAGVNGLNIPACGLVETPYVGSCAESAAPTILVWGDSLSQAITPAIAASTDQPIAQASMGQCAPLLGLAPVDNDASAEFARACVTHNQTVLDYAVHTPSLRVVILTGWYVRYALPTTRALDTQNGTIHHPSLDAIAAAQGRVTNALRAAGKRVIVIAPPPQAAFDVGACWERTLVGLPTVMASPACSLVPANRHPHEPEARLMLATFATHGTPVLRLDRLMCPSVVCPTMRENVVLYRDGTHLSRSGAIVIGHRLALGGLAWKAAR